jgi:hypothetical protein
MPRITASLAAAAPEGREDRAGASETGAPPSGQLTLFVTDRRPLPVVGGFSTEDGEHRAGHSGVTVEDDRQIGLFAPRAVLSRDLDIALVQGRFEEAERLRRLMDDNYGGSVETESLGFLDRLGGGLWKRPPGEALATWAEIDALLEPSAPLQARVRDGVFARLLESHAPERLAEARLDCLPALTHVLARNAETSDGRRRARLLVRDALVAGRGLEPLDFRHDPPVADLLAENLAPRWMACLGAIRRLWPVPPPGGGDVARLRDQAVPCASDDDAAQEFGRCLGVADDPRASEECRHAARRRLKQLQPDFHGQYMRRASRPAVPETR